MFVYKLSINYIYMQIGYDIPAQVNNNGIIEHTSKYREIMIAIPPEKLGLEEWETATIFDVGEVPPWSYTYNGQKILSLAVIGPHGEVLLFANDPDQTSDICMTDEQICSPGSRVRSTQILNTQSGQHVQPILLEPNKILTETDILCSLPIQTTDATNQYFASNFVEEINTLRQEAQE